MKQRSSRSVFSIGITSVVLIFVMLCLLTFAVLSLVSARADLRLSQKSADRTSEYYDAENRATDVLFSVADCMEKHLDGADESSFLTAVREELEGIENITFTDDSHLAYSVSQGEEQLLAVELTLSYTPFDDGNHYRIDSWKTVSTHEWNPDTELPVLDSESLSGIADEDEGAEN